MSYTLTKLDDPLNGDNCFTWRVMCEAALDGRALICMIDGSTPGPTSLSPPRPLAWNDQHDWDYLPANPCWHHRQMEDEE